MKTDVWQGTLALMILRTLETLGPLHGYGIARRIEQTSGKAKYYKLTRAGRNRIEREAKEWVHTTEIVARFLASRKEAM